MLIWQTLWATDLSLPLTHLVPCRPLILWSSALQLADTLAAVPRMRPEAFNRLFDDNLQDLLMVSYLSSLTRTQLAIAEKLAT